MQNPRLATRPATATAAGVVENHEPRVDGMILLVSSGLSDDHRHLAAGRDDLDRPAGRLDRHPCAAVEMNGRHHAASPALGRSKKSFGVTAPSVASMIRRISAGDGLALPVRTFHMCGCEHAQRRPISASVRP